LPPVQDLAVAYRPNLLFDRGDFGAYDNDHWRPVNLDLFVQEQFSTPDSSDSFTRHMLCDAAACPTVFSDVSQLSSGTATRLNIYGHHDGSSTNEYATYKSGVSICNTQDSSRGSLFDCDSGIASKIYFVAGSDSAGYRYLDYWEFYRYNYASGTVIGAGASYDHEGDWEGQTIVLDPVGHASSPVITAVYLAQHSLGSWYLPGAFTTTGGRVDVYVANGTHSSYADSCVNTSTTYCASPEGYGLGPEADRDGAAAWGNNSDSNCANTCVGRMAVPGSAGQAFAFWPGKWGFEDNSPNSPGLQERFTCAWHGYSAETSCSNGRPANSRLMTVGQRDAGAVPVPSACRSWLGAGVAAIVCNAAELAKTRRGHQMDKTAGLRVTAGNRRAARVTGLTQLMGQPLSPGERISISGPVKHGTLMYAYVVDRSGHVHLVGGELPATNERDARVAFKVSATATTSHLTSHEVVLRQPR
jgi:hypothetical protein